MTGALDILTHLYYQLYMPSAFFTFNLIAISSLLFQYLNILLYFDKVSIDSINFLFPFEGINFSLKNLVLLGLFFKLVLAFELTLEKINLCFLNGKFWFFDVLPHKTWAFHSVSVDFYSIYYFILAFMLFIAIFLKTTVAVRIVLLRYYWRQKFKISPIKFHIDQFVNELANSLSMSWP